MAESRGAIPERIRRALYTLSRGRCYAPECDEPVIVIDGGEPVFVGEVAHIVAALEAGPRGSADVGDREVFENLLILCGRHHKIVDNPRTGDRYPVEVLREWKTTHEAEFDTATRTELSRLPDLQDLPELLVAAFRDATVELEATVDRLEAAGHLARETAQLLHIALARTSSSGPVVGDGIPGIKEAFEEAYDAASGASFLGLPSSDAYEIGPGFVQRLRGARCGHPAVICALNGRTAVVVTAELWDGIALIGDSAAGGGVHGVGFPVSSTGGDQRYIGPSIGHVPTAGGSWGPGAMVRTDDWWTWIPDLAFDPDSGGDAGSAIESQSPRDLRLRLVERMAVTLGDHRVTAAGRRHVITELAKPGMTTILTALATGRTAVPADLAWRAAEEPYGRNDSWAATYDCAINTADGQSAIRGRLQYLMPHFTSPDITSVIEAELDFDACQAERCISNAPVAQRLSLSEIVDFFTGAWVIAFNILPLAANEPTLEANPGGRPRVGLYIINERSPNTGGERTFRMEDLVDLSPFGVTTKSYLSQLDIAVLGRGSLSEHEARDVIQKALVRIAENSGFDAADLVTW